MVDFRVQELEYIRSELNQRLSFSYEHSNKLFGHILFVWGGALILSHFEQMLFVMATIFFISVVVIYLLSQRNSENLIKISTASAYITIFYEEKPMIGEQDRIFWSLATLKIHKIIPPQNGKIGIPQNNDKKQNRQRGKKCSLNTKMNIFGFRA